MGMRPFTGPPTSLEMWLDLSTVELAAKSRSLFGYTENSRTLCQNVCRWSAEPWVYARALDHLQFQWQRVEQYLGIRPIGGLSAKF